MFGKKTVTRFNGNKRWYNHCKSEMIDDGPAVEYRDGNERWYDHGKFEMIDDGPAVELDSEIREKWYITLRKKLHNYVPFSK